MITLIEAGNFRCLKYISQPLKKFQVLVGPNASGKTTFLDVVGFMADVVKNGIDFAITSRVSHFDELTFANSGGNIELAIETALPEEILNKLPEPDFKTLRYEMKIGIVPDTGEYSIIEERVLFLKGNAKKTKQQEQLTIFPSAEQEPSSLLFNKQKYETTSCKNVITKIAGGNDNFYPETYEKGNRGFMPSFKLGIKKSALGNLPADETKFPAATWLKEFLTEGVQFFVLDSLKIRKSSAPGLGKKFRTDGSNLPWMIEELKKNPKKFDRWIKHVQTALSDIENIVTVSKEEDKHRYLKIKYKNIQREVPSWLISDGTLRFLALTLPAYLSNFTGLYLIEEPENGIHPKVIESVFQSLSSVYDAQILLASHSPVILSMVNPADVLCFSKTEDGITDIVRGNEHPKLKNWKGETDFSVLFASGVLG